MDKKVLAHDIKKGMFVSALDRPWTDTPFMLQGFLVEDDEDLARLQKYCRYVHVDLSRSVGDDYALEDAMLRKAAEPPPQPKVVNRQKWQEDLDAEVATKAPPKSVAAKKKPGAVPGEPDAPARRSVVRPARRHEEPDARVTWAAEITDEEAALLDGPDARADDRRVTEGRGFGIGWLRAMAESVGVVGDWFRRSEVPKFDGVPVKRSDALTPMTARVIVYQETQTLAEELPRARQALERSHDVLKQIVDDVQARGVVHLEKADEVVNELVDSMQRNPNALIWLSRLKNVDRRAYAHSMQTAVYMVALGLQLGLARDELNHLSLAGMMLDVGKLRVPQGLLEKPGKLTDAEFAEVRRHVEHSLAILAESRGVHAKVLEAVKRHHEREDGSGYPRGKRGEAIGLYGRMAGLVDTFVALTNPRSYADTLSMHEALRQLYNWRGTQFHEPLVEQFVQAVGVFPVGSLVELTSGEVAVVISHNRVRRLKPRVLLLTGPDKTPLRRPVSLDLLYAPSGPNNEELTIAHALPSGAYGIDPHEFYLQ